MPSAVFEYGPAKYKKHEIEDINRNYYRRSPSQAFSNYDNVCDIQKAMENCTYQRTSTPIPPSSDSTPTIEEEPDTAYQNFCKDLQKPPTSFKVNGVNKVLLGVIAGQLNLDLSSSSDTRKKVEITREVRNVSPKNGFILFVKNQLIKTRIWETKRSRTM